MNDLLQAKNNNETKIKVGAVSYLNTKPLIYGIEKGMMTDEVELHIGYPAKIAAELLSGTIDVGLVPVAIIPLLKEAHIISNYCIGCDGEVATVAIFSDVPVNEIETVLLDYQSRTSVQLAQILLKNHWKVQPKFEAAATDFIEKIGGTTAAVIIGDRAFEQKGKFKYMFDLGAAWKAYTGLPFVFATWISNKPLSDGFCTRFNAANAMGFEQLDTVIAQNPYPLFNLRQYYTQYIQFGLDDRKREGLQHFLHLLSENPAPNSH
ncbi:MAG: menaquinone biosynthetic enzyme MqnA/MqnD family protein [Ferruginibacter sp.]